MRIARVLILAVLAGGTLVACGEEPFDMHFLCYALKKEEVAKQAGIKARSLGPSAVMEDQVHRCTWAAEDTSVKTKYLVELSIAAKPERLRLPRHYEDREDLPKIGTGGYRGFDKSKDLESVSTTANGWTLNLNCQHLNAKFTKESCANLAKLVVQRMPKREPGQAARLAA